jgi:predicted NAD-dependent protein-ADP-ribosyltransferase YbiA (DUF1768 family)
MVKSILDKRLEYNESREIDTDDLDFDANLYETKIYDRDIVFALGKPKYTYIDNNIVYYPMYLVEKDEIKMQLGLYEILANTQTEILDADGDIDLNKFDKPLLYSFTLEVMGKIPVANKGKEKGTEKKSAAKNQLWIQNFMNDPNYGIIDTKYDGNCFFNAVRLALEENEQEISVDEMRDVLATNVTEEIFQNYKSLYEDFKSNEATLTREIKNITGRFNALQTKMKTTKDRSLQLSFSKQSDDMKKLHEELKGDRKATKENLKDFEFMAGIDNLSMLKLKIKTSDFWADTWAISTLEREMNIKIVIFSELNYKEGDEMNVLQCGQLNDRVLEERGIFEPSFYVLVSHHGGYHYQMITYNNMKTFTFEELPVGVKDLIKEKCLERMTGPYALIPEFRGASPPSPPLEAALLTEGETKLGEEAQPHGVEGVEPLSDLYDSATIFRFYSKSADKPLPGKGEGEKLGPEGSGAYTELARIPQWRKKLSNGWPAEFKLDGHKWLTAEHYYQASKFKKGDRAFYLQFSLDAKDSSLAKNVDLAKAAGGKSGKLKDEQVRPKDVSIDADFYYKSEGSKLSRGEMELENALRAKFTQNSELKQLLMGTKKAKLEHIVRSKPAEVFNELMRVRRELTQIV